MPDDFIDREALERLVRDTPGDPARAGEALAKGRAKEPLSVQETAALLAARSPESEERLLEAARALKREVYGNRIVLFAPLYAGNRCVNDCGYCGFRRSLGTAVRRTLSEAELQAEARALADQGHKRLILVFGEHPDYGPGAIARAVRAVYAAKSGPGEIRRVNINAAPLEAEGFRAVHEAGIGTYQIFQETYHRPTYARWHPAGTRKGDFLWRLHGLHRAFEGGCDDVGIGALLGLHDWRFEVLGLVAHARRLKADFGVGPHTVSFPRVKPAHGLEADLPWAVSDADFRRAVAILRLAIPYAGLILTAREPAELRGDLMECGISQIDAGTRLEIGGYAEKAPPAAGEGAPRGQDLRREQFLVGDTRTLADVSGWLAQNGYVPSFCTSCYRRGRTGAKFMELALPGKIGGLCAQNALATFAEYLRDYAGEAARAGGMAFIARELEALPGPARESARRMLDRVEAGESDVGT